MFNSETDTDALLGCLPASLDREKPWHQSAERRKQLTRREKVGLLLAVLLVSAELIGPHTQ